MTTTPLQKFLAARHRAHPLPLACLFLLSAIPAAHAAGPASARNPLEAPPVLSADNGADGRSRAADGPAARDALADGTRGAASARHDAMGLARTTTDPDWRFRLNLAGAPGDRPSSTPLAQRAVKLSLSRSF